MKRVDRSDDIVVRLDPDGRTSRMKLVKWIRAEGKTKRVRARARERDTFFHLRDEMTLSCEIAPCGESRLF